MTPCPSCGYDASRLSPADGAAALRSLPRRFQELADRARRDGAPDDVGRFIEAEAGGAAQAIAASTPALQRALVADDAQLDPPSSPSGAAASGAAASGATGSGAIAALSGATTSAAAVVEGAAASAWGRTAHRGGSAVTPLDLLGEMVHDGVHHLRTASQRLPEADD